MIFLHFTMCCPFSGELAHQEFYEANPEVNHEDVCRHAIREYYAKCLDLSTFSTFTFEFEPAQLGCHGTLMDGGEPSLCFSLTAKELRKI